MVLQVKGRRQSISRGQDDDPLTKAMAPPPNETEAEREERLAAEREAQKRSDAIDEELNRQRINDKKTKCVRVLLLGQSESGKSTTLKNFQLFHSPKAFRTERASWRAIVQLNVVRSIKLILDAITEAQTSSSHSAIIPTSDSVSSPPSLTPEHLRLKMRLSPLQQVEELLLRKLTPAGSAEFEATQLSPLTNLPYSARAGNAATELALNSTTPWKAAFNKLIASTTRTSLESQDIDFDDPKDPGLILNACKDDINALWTDPTIRQLLEVQKIRLQDFGGFFLDQLERVTSLKYVPTDDDILRARLKTIGVSEHRFTLKAGNMMSHDWRVFDVGGARSFRGMTCSHLHVHQTNNNATSAAWVPYFDNMDAIIFLAPISCFDQVLAEDPNVNRLEDSILLWKSVVSNPLLKSTDIVLFLNKVDILKEKLKSGVSFGHYVVSYGNRPNDFESTSKYLSKKFAGILKQSSPLSRTFYYHLTTVTGSKSSDKLLEAFAEKLAETLLQGEVHVGDWSTEEGAKIKLTFGPSSKKPLHVPLIELTSAEAASHATDVFLDIALQAQSRKCRLHPDQFATSHVSPPPRIDTARPLTTSTLSTTAPRLVAPLPHRDSATDVDRKAEPSGSGFDDQKAQDEIKALKAELEKQKQQAIPSISRKSTAVPKPPKGASLANPNKKARKYQAIEFESDDE
ncbi:hypothetical protein D9615_002338 [Tricholomella constricta]|uniref:Guanine nucleotide-binding protein alpha-4 subunit n=1 Tax=Tricholomella constricta TaxID=117010 RepID=A0A8H5HLQ2_9AGAR|nr:hypothetical protein D9615_002338 [Tricholomella constricta]